MSFFRIPLFGLGGGEFFSLENVVDDSICPNPLPATEVWTREVLFSDRS